MIFRRLVELHQSMLASGAYVRGLAVSAVVHLLVVGGWIGSSDDSAPENPPEDFTPVEYLIPKERLVASRPVEEKVTFTTLLPPDAGAGFDIPEPEPTPKELEVVAPTGDSADTEVAKNDLFDQPPIPLGDSILTELEVDSAVIRYDDSAAPQYPPDLLRRRVEGYAIVQYVVDTTGRADTATFRVVTASHVEFARAVRATLPFMRFRPAVVANRRVPQLVQQPFAFRIVDSTATSADGGKRPPQP